MMSGQKYQGLCSTNLSYWRFWSDQWPAPWTSIYNRYANVLADLNLGNVFVLTVIGGLFCAKRRRWFNHWWSHGLSGNWSSFTGPIAQVSQQLNFFVLMALAGGDRVLDLWTKKKKSTKESDVGQLWTGRRRNGRNRSETKWAWNTSSKWQLPVGQIRWGHGSDHVDFLHGRTNPSWHHPARIRVKSGLCLSDWQERQPSPTWSTASMISNWMMMGSLLNWLEKDSSRRSLGIVLQDTHLFTGTIASIKRMQHGRNPWRQLGLPMWIPLLSTWIRAKRQSLDWWWGCPSNGQRQLDRHCPCSPLPRACLDSGEATSSGLIRRTEDGARRDVIARWKVG